MRRLFIPILLLTLAAAAFAQDSTAVTVPPRAQVFSGFVTEFTPNSLSVSRKNASGKEMVHKSFIVDAHTKVEGKIRLNVRVTVQYMVEGESNHAVRVIVRGT